ncbi:MAG: nitrilase family protein, partial [Flavobacteriales bacterium]|nr:nitrilase family protein [Flavobacteriales bacterium]
MKETLKIGLCQTELEWEDSDANLSRLELGLSELDADVDLAILPEMFNTGFTMNAPGVAQTMDGAAVAWMKKMTRNRDIALCGSAVIEDSGKYFNRFLWSEKGEIVEYYDKRHLFRMADEHETFSPGKRQV